MFEKAYGPEGAWVQLFRRDARYRGTRLLRDVAHERVYVTMDEWESREAYEEFRERYADKYTAIDATCERLTVKELCLGGVER